MVGLHLCRRDGDFQIEIICFWPDICLKILLVVGSIMQKFDLWHFPQVLQSVRLSTARRFCRCQERSWRRVRYWRRLLWPVFKALSTKNAISSTRSVQHSASPRMLQSGKIIQPFNWRFAIRELKIYRVWSTCPANSRLRLVPNVPAGDAARTDSRDNPTK